MLENLKKQEMKMLYISGDEDVCFFNGTQKLGKFLSKPTLKVINKCGHVCSIEKYKEFNEKALNFLDLVHNHKKELCATN